MGGPGCAPARPQQRRPCRPGYSGPLHLWGRGLSGFSRFRYKRCAAHSSAAQAAQCSLSAPAGARLRDSCTCGMRVPTTPLQSSGGEFPPSVATACRRIGLQLCFAQWKRAKSDATMQHYHQRCSMRHAGARCCRRGSTHRQFHTQARAATSSLNQTLDDMHTMDTQQSQTAHFTL